MQFSTSGQLTGSTKLVTKNQSSGAAFDVYRLSDTALHTIIVIAGIFVFISSVFVGTYFYKHCIKKTVFANNPGQDPFPKLIDGYNSLELCAQRSENQLSDPTYLEPVSNPIPHYDEIIDHSERSTKSVSDVLSHSEIENKQLIDFFSNYCESRNYYLSSDEKKKHDKQGNRKVFKTSSL